MKVLWTFMKAVLVLVLAIPVSILVLATALGILGTLVGIAVLVLKLAVFAVVGWGAFRLIRHLMRPRRGPTRSVPTPDLPPVDPHWDAAMRELDREFGLVPR